MVAQNAAPSKKHFGGHLPYAFLPEGAVMLAGILKTKQAIKASINIIRWLVGQGIIFNLRQELGKRLIAPSAMKRRRS